MILIWIFLSKKEKISNSDYNLIIELEKYSDTQVNEINEEIKSHSSESKISKIEKEKDKTFIYYNATFDSLGKLNSLIKKFSSKSEQIKYTIFENRIID